MSAPRQLIFIITDTMGPALVGAYGSRLGLTPHIDRFAGGAVRFDHAYTPCPLCTPARSVLYTGLPAAVNGAWSLEMPIGSGVRTLPERLSAAGVPCAHIGKWHLSATDYFDTGDAPPGWDPEWWFDGRAHLESLPPEVRPRTRRLPADGEPPVAREHTFAGGVTDRALRFLEARSGDDFFLALSYDEPHAPYVAPEPFASRHHDTCHPIGASARDSLIGKPASHRHWRDDPGLARPAHARVEDGCYFDQPYFACTAFVDDEIGRVLDAARRFVPDALVVITSDHGDMMGAHGLFKKGPAMYEEIVRVPLVVGRAGGGGPGPGGAPPGGRAIAGRGVGVTTPATLLDVTPTVLSWFGVAGPHWLPGADLLTLAGGDSDAERAVPLEFGRFSPYNDGRGGFRPIRGLVTARYKLVINMLDSDELYDLEADLGETSNLIDDPAYASVRDGLHDRMLAAMDESRDPFRGPEWRYRPWRDPHAYAWPQGGRGRRRDLHEKPLIDYMTGEERA